LVDPVPIETADLGAKDDVKITPIAEVPARNLGDPNYVFVADRVDGAAIELSGFVPDEAVKRDFGDISGDVAVDGLSLVAGAPDDFAQDAERGIRALLEVPNGRLIYEDHEWAFSGRSADAAERALSASKLYNLSKLKGWMIEIDVPSPADICGAWLTDFSKNNSVLFSPASARISSESNDSIEQLANTLETCPKSFINVEGHTDADGDENANLILSISRAEAVVDALIERGIGEERLFAIGYGESLPVTTNDTVQGKSQNRRIVFSMTTKKE
jgi:OOP family OmpA-OmpF porin